MATSYDAIVIGTAQSGPSLAANLFDHDLRRVSDRIACFGLCIDPPLGRVGMTEDQARATRSFTRAST